MIGSQGAEAVKAMIEHGQKPTSGTVASVLGVITLLFGASGYLASSKPLLINCGTLSPRLRAA